MKIAHLADIHIGSRAGSSAEYCHAFDKLVANIPADAIVVICGDIFHNKTYYGPDDISDFKYLMTVLAPWNVIMIPGNHDMNMNNPTQLDLISPLVDQFPNLLYITRSGPFNFDPNWNKAASDDCPDLPMVKFHHMSVADNSRELPENPSEYILLYHGGVEGCDVAKFMHNVLPAATYSQFKIALLGDIHKHQIMGNAVYPGSLIQQNHGEDPNKGFVLWHFDDSGQPHPQFVPIVIPVRFCTLDLRGVTTEDEIKEVCRRPENHSRITNMRIITDCEGKELIKKQRDIAGLTVGKQINTVKKVMPRSRERNCLDLNAILDSYLKAEGISPEHCAIVQSLHKENCSGHKFTEWSIQYLEWDNFYKYGNCNKIDFTKINGFGGIIAPNRSGKSSIFDLIVFILFGDPLRGGCTDVIRSGAQIARVKILFTVNGEQYEITRIIRTNGGGKHRFVKITSTGLVDVEHDGIAGMYGVLNKLIGTKEDFLKSALYYDQNEIVVSKKLYTILKPLLGFIDENVTGTIKEQKRKLVTSIKGDKTFGFDIGKILLDQRELQTNHAEIFDAINKITVIITANENHLIRSRATRDQVKQKIGSMQNPDELLTQIKLIETMLKDENEKLQNLGDFSEVLYAEPAYISEGDEIIALMDTPIGSEVLTKELAAIGLEHYEQNQIDISAIDQRIEQLRLTINYLNSRYDNIIFDMPYQDCYQQLKLINQQIDQNKYVEIIIPPKLDFDKLINELEELQTPYVNFTESEYVIAKHEYESKSKIGLKVVKSNDELSLMRDKITILRKQLNELDGQRSLKLSSVYNEKKYKFLEELATIPAESSITLEDLQARWKPFDILIDEISSQIFVDIQYDFDHHMDLICKRNNQMHKIKPVEDYSNLRELRNMIHAHEDPKIITKKIEDIKDIPLEIEYNVDHIQNQIRSYKTNMKFTDGCISCDHNKQNYEQELYALEKELQTTNAKNDKIRDDNLLIEYINLENSKIKDQLLLSLQDSIDQETIQAQINQLELYESQSFINAHVHCQIEILSREIDRVKLQKEKLDNNTKLSKQLEELLNERSLYFRDSQQYEIDEISRKHRENIRQKIQACELKYEVSKLHETICNDLNTIEEIFTSINDENLHNMHHNDEFNTISDIYFRLSRLREDYENHCKNKTQLEDIKKKKREWEKAVKLAELYESKRDEHVKLIETRDQLQSYLLNCRGFENNKNEVITKQTELKDLENKKHQYDLYMSKKIRHDELSQQRDHVIIVEQARIRIENAEKYKSHLRTHEKKQILVNIQKLQKKLNKLSEALKISEMYSDFMDEIRILEMEQKELEYSIRTNESELGKLRNQFESKDKKLKEIILYLENNRDILDRIRAFDIYINFLESQAIKSAYDEHIDKIFNAVNINLSNITDFIIHHEKTISNGTVKLKLSIVDKSTGGDNKIALPLSSTFQKFITAIIFRLVLSESLLHTSKFLLIDEGFGSVDHENLPKVIEFLSMMKSNYDFIMIISHLDELQNSVDCPLHIRSINENGAIYSHINNTDNAASTITEIGLIKGVQSETKLKSPHEKQTIAVQEVTDQNLTVAQPDISANDIESDKEQKIQDIISNGGIITDDIKMSCECNNKKMFAKTYWNRHITSKTHTKWQKMRDRYKVALSLLAKKDVTENN